MTLGKVAIIGPGLLGGSIALALRERGLAREFALYGRRPESLIGAEAHGMNSFCTTDLAATVRDAEFCILATPVGAMPTLLQAAIPNLPPGAIITDVGSVKGQIVAELEALCAGTPVTFIGSHPMAGSEQTGFAAARADLFEGATCFVTPTAESPLEAVQLVQRFWQDLGARVATVSPAEHDPIVARISHVPHLLASLLVNLVASQPGGREEMVLCGNGFRDSTRIASGSPTMWAEILLENREAVAASLGNLAQAVEQARALIAAGDEPPLLELLAKAKDARDSLPDKR